MSHMLLWEPLSRIVADRRSDRVGHRNPVILECSYKSLEELRFTLCIFKRGITS